MADRWWRAYERSRRDPKLQRLPAETFRGWYNLVCLSSEHGGKLPSVADTAFELRKSEEAITKLLAALEAAELFEQKDGVWSPRKWNVLQYKSDSSTPRVQAFRERRRNVSGNATETPSESEADTETDSAPNGAGARAPVDPVKTLFDDGVKLLTENGCREPNARTLIGKWRREHGDEATQAAIKAARTEGITEPIAWITQRFAGKPRETWDQRRIREAREAIQ